MDEPTVADLRKLLDECLLGTDYAEPTRLNKQKTSADLLAVRFPTFVTRRSRSSSVNNQSSSLRVPPKLPTIPEEKEADSPIINNEPTDIRKSKYCSTSTLHFKNTISLPDLSEVIQCIARAIHVHIIRGTDRPQKCYIDIFNESKNPLMSGWDTIHTPSEYVITEYIRVIFQYHKMDVECSVMSLIYIERFLEISGMTMDATNWRRIILAAIIVSDKVWEEHAVWTQDFLHLFNDFITVQDLNNLELQFLGMIRYKLGITASTYAMYYFELRSFCNEESKLPPLKKKVARRLERQTSKHQLVPKKTGRSMSLGESSSIKYTNE